MRQGRTILRLCPALLIAALLSACAVSRPGTIHPADGSYFTTSVEPGDTVSVLARRWRVNEEDILALNDLHDRDAAIRARSLRIPAYGHLQDPRFGPKQPAAAHAPEADIARKVPVPRQRPAALRNAGVEIAAIPEPRPLSRESEVQSTPDSPRSWWSGWLTPLDSTQAPHADFGWPLKGRVIEGFGPGDGGERNDGINILAKRGAPIKAAAEGTVTYVGDELKGYGNLVLIRHGNGYVTAYAHADSVIVERGQHVRRGQVIGFAGTSGDVERPQLHFEIRQGTTPLDPARFLMAAR